MFTATSLKKLLRESCPLTLNQTIRAVQELEKAKLIATVETIWRSHAYAPTQAGVRLVAYLEASKHLAQPTIPSREV